MTTVIEPYSDRYREAVRDLILPIQTTEFGLSIRYEDQPDLADITSVYQRGAGGFWLAIGPGGTVVGTIGLIDIGQSQGALRKMFVHEDYRGGPSRIAHRLLETLLAAARAQGLTEVILGTTDRYLAAHRFYEKAGFVATPVGALPSNFPRMAVDNVFYTLTL